MMRGKMTGTAWVVQLQPGPSPLWISVDNAELATLNEKDAFRFTSKDAARLAMTIARTMSPYPAAKVYAVKGGNKPSAELVAADEHARAVVGAVRMALGMSEDVKLGTELRPFDSCYVIRVTGESEYGGGEYTRGVVGQDSRPPSKSPIDVLEMVYRLALHAHLGDTPGAWDAQADDE